jgi:hypothetical protein
VKFLGGLAMARVFLALKALRVGVWESDGCQNVAAHDGVAASVVAQIGFATIKIRACVAWLQAHYTRVAGDYPRAFAAVRPPQTGHRRGRLVLVPFFW